MSGADYFDDIDAINAHMDSKIPIDRAAAIDDHAAIREALEQAGIEVMKVAPPVGCQDGVYTANWGLCRGDKIIVSSLPNTRQRETPYAVEIFKNLGKTIIYPPEGLRFSGQGDALPVGAFLLAGSTYRTDAEMHQFIGQELGLSVVSLQTVPALDENNQPIINAVTGWPDSFFYDLDLVIAVLKDDLIAWCPEALTPESQNKIAALPLQKIEVSLAEAKEGLACNLISTGETVVMSSLAPELKRNIEAAGLRTITPQVTQLQKGGGFIRCTSLTI